MRYVDGEFTCSILSLIVMQEKKEMRQATPAERIEQLEAMKARHMTHRAELQVNIDRLTTDTTVTSDETHEQSG